jgi:hypothetical protein
MYIIPKFKPDTRKFLGPRGWTRQVPFAVVSKKTHGVDRKGGKSYRTLIYGVVSEKTQIVS